MGHIGYNGKTHAHKTYQPRIIGEPKVDTVTQEIYRLLNKLGTSIEKMDKDAREQYKELLTRVTQHTHAGGVSPLWGIPVVAAAPAAVANMAIPYILSAEPFRVYLVFEDGTRVTMYEYVGAYP